MLVVLTLLLVLAGRFVRGFRSWLVGLGWQPVVALHLTRLLGLYFLYLYKDGQLPRAFAVPGGIGDILVAFLAVGLLLARRHVPQRPHLLLGWNAWGLADILFVVATAARLAIRDPGSMAALLRLPLSLLPTFLVPIIIGSHIWLFAERRRWRAA
jgi:hypothetical protein